MTYRQVFQFADRAAKNALYGALQIARGKAQAPNDVRPKLRGWQAITTLEGK